MHSARRPIRPTRALALALLVLPVGACLAARHGISKLERTPGQHQLVVELPAVDLPAAATHETAPQPDPSWTLVPADGWLHGFTVEVVDRAGRQIHEVILHHVKLMTPGKRELFMPIMLRVVGAGSETGSGAVPHYLGYPIQAGDSVLATAMVHNPGDTPFDGVRIRVRLHYTKRLDPARTYRVTAVYHNPTGDTLRDAGMGTIAGVFQPAGAWPMVSRTDSVYLLDRSRELAGAHGHHGLHGHHH